MKKFLLNLLFLSVGILSYGQISLPFTFESTPVTSDFTNFAGGNATVIANPQSSGINTSGKVGQMVKGPGGQPFGGTTIELSSGIDFSAGTTFKMKVYAPKIGTKVLFKVEDKSDAADNFEKEVLTTKANEWEELTFDYSGIDQTKTFDKLVFIFDNGITGDGTANFTYLFDDLMQMASPLSLPFTFESTPVTSDFTNFAGGNATVIANPQSTGINTSGKVGQMVKGPGGQPFGGTVIELGSGIDFSAGTTFKMKVYAPKIGTKVLFKVENKNDASTFFEKEVLTTKANEWEELTFDYSGIEQTKTFDKLVFIFDNGTTGDGTANFTYLFDDLIQMATPLSLPFTFESTPVTSDFTNFAGGNATVIANPKSSGINTSGKVGQMVKGPGGQPFGGTVIELGSGIDFSAGTTFKMKVYAPKVGTKVLLKVEDKSDASTFFEKEVLTTKANEWEELTFDYSGIEQTKTFDKLVFIFDNGTTGDGTANFTYLFDDLMLMNTVVPPAANKIVFPVDFQCPFINYTFTDFEGTFTELSDNPKAAGLNTSTKVAKTTKGSGAKTFAGTIVTLENPIDFSISSIFKVKVYSPKANSTVKLKLENITNGSIADEIDATTTKTNEWEELTFDFSNKPVSGKSLQKVIIFFDFGNVGDGSIYYFDDISQMGNTGMTDCQAPTMPTTGAPTPPPCDQVISIFSEAFTDRAGTDFNPNFGQTTQYSTEVISGNNVIKLTNFNFQGNNLAGPIYVDATAMTHINLNYWTPDLTDFRVKLVDFGANNAAGGGDDVEHELTFTVSKMREWVTLNIPLTDFTGLTARNNLGQIIYSTTNPGGTVFLDNIYFNGDCNVVPSCPQMVWEDNFDGTTLNTANWEQQIGDGTAEGIPGWGNNELQYYRAENTSLANGILTITAKQESFGGKAYTSSRMRTKNKQDFTYGRFEARMKMPVGQGLWPAFWMLSTDEVYGGWPKSGEIDIMEYLGHERDKVFGTIHFGDFVPNNKSTGTDYRLNSGGFNDDFHKFAIEWDENVIRWYVDDVLYGTKTAADIAPEFWPFNQKFHFLMNVAVGGNLPGSPDASTVFPQTMQVDYVRVYKGQFPYLSGNQSVANKAANQVYSVGNAPAGSTFNWTVPAGATLVSGQGTSAITVNWGETPGNSDISVAVASSCTTKNLKMNVKVDIARVSVQECVFENFDTAPLITPLTSNEAGTLQEDVANPAPNSVNGSALVAKYTRSTNKFDNFQYSTTAVPDAAKFVSGDKKFFIDIYTAAPIGTPILLQLENAAKSTGTFPIGRHSTYEGKTTVQNAWERIELTHKAILNGSVANNEVDKMVFLFNANTSTTDVYYFDNFDKYCTSSTNECAKVDPCIPASTCGITNIMVGDCANGKSNGTQVITVRDASNPNCAASIEAPICSDGTLPEVRFTATGSAASSKSFELYVNGALKQTGGSNGVFPSSAPTVSVTDPCNCDDPLNVRDGKNNIVLYHDVLTFTGTGPVVCTSNCGAFLDKSGNPITNFGTSPGTVEFFRVPGDYAAATFTVGGITANLAGGSCGDNCPFNQIPTMSEWGLLIFGLLLLNLGAFFIYRKEVIMNL